MDVTTNVGRSTAVQPRSYSSLLPFLEVFTNNRLFKNSYILVDPILSTDWFRFQVKVGSVASYSVIENSEDEPVVSASVFTQMVSKLEGAPFFPNLTAIHVKDLENFLIHYHLLLSPKIEMVSAVFSSSWEDTQGGIGAFIQALISFAPKIRFLSIIYAQRPIVVSNIFGINYLTSLRTLVVSRLAGVQSAVDILSFLKDLTELEELDLTIGDSVKSWSPTQTCLLSKPDRTVLLTDSSCLKSLQRLRIKGPSQIICDLLGSLSSPNLVSLSLVSTCWLHAKQLPQLRDEPLDASERQTQAPLDHLSDQQPAGLLDRLACTDACRTSPHHHQWALSKWLKTLEDLAVSSCRQTTFDLSGISKLEALKSLTIKGSTTPLTELFSSGIPASLETLDLSFPDSHLTLFELGEIAMHAPGLLKLSSSFCFGSESELDSLAETTSRSHKLEELRMNKTLIADAGNLTVQYTSKVARCLHLLFPNLKQLQYPSNDGKEVEFWEGVWDLVQLFQKIVLDAKQCRPLVKAGVTTDSDSVSRLFNVAVEGRRSEARL